MSSFVDLAQIYARGVEALAAPPGARRGVERGGAGPAEPASLADEAEQLADVSSKLNEAAIERLSDTDPAVRAETEVALLAKALTDLELSAYLYRAAADEELGQPAASRGEERAAAPHLGEHLADLLPGAAARPRALDRGAGSPADIPSARAALAREVEDTLELVQARAVKAGQAALGSLASLGAAELAQAAGVVGMSLAGALGQAEKVTRLYQLFRSFALGAYNSVLALLGPSIAESAAKEVVAWVGAVAQGEHLEALLTRLYETGETAQDLRRLAEGSGAELAAFTAAIEGLGALGEQFSRRMKLTEQLLRGLRLLSGVPTAALPAARLLFAAAFVALAAYAVLAGADYVDSRRIRLLDRVPGVRRVVEARLNSTQEQEKADGH